MTPADFIIYEIKTAVLFGAFYLFYRLLLSKETFHRLNRAVLLCSAMVASLLPLLRITIHKTVEAPALPETVIDNIRVLDIALPSENTFMVEDILLYILAAGAVAILANTAVSIYSVMRIIRRCKRIPQQDGTVIAVTRRNTAPFSWMRYIVLSEEDWQGRHDEIILHEKAHIRLGHSWDLLLMDLFTALQWFNPVIWMLRSDIRAIHEYEADREVLKSGINATQYQLLLIKKAVGMSGHSITNSFNHSTLKKRITMMSSKKSTLAKALRVLYAIPLVGLCIVANAKTEVTYVAPAADRHVAAGDSASTEASFTVSYTYTDYGKDTKTSDPDKSKIIMKSGKYTIDFDNSTGTVSFSVQDDGNSVKTIDVDQLLAKKGISISKDGGSTIIDISDDGIDKDDLFFDLAGNTRFQINGEDITGQSQGVRIKKDGYPEKICITSSPEGDGIIINMVDNEESDQDDKTYQLGDVQVKPKFQGEEAAGFTKWILEHLEYPEEAVKNKIEGIVVIQFTIDKNGKLVNPSILKGANELLDNEALRVVKESPQWEPAMIKGKPVGVTFALPVTFRIK